MSGRNATLGTPNPHRDCSSTRSSSRPRCPEALGARGGELPADLAGEHEPNVLVDGLQLGDIVCAAPAEERDESLDKLLGSTGARGDADRLDALEPGLVDLTVVVDQIGIGPVLAGDLTQPVGVR